MGTDNQCGFFIRWTDADTIIANPAVPLHALLPTPSLRPVPLILGNQDHNGFNNGAMFLHVEPLLIQLLDDILALEAKLLVPWRHSPSDQRLMGMVLQENNVMGSRFFEIPQQWTNAYSLDRCQESTTTCLQIHLVAHLKRRMPYVKILEAADEVYMAAQALADSNRTVAASNGLELMEAGVQAKVEARRWWEQARSGIQDIVFNDI